MKTRFSDLLKVKKQKLSEVERELQDVRERKKRLEGKIEAINFEIASLKQPKSGDFTLMQIARETFLSLMNQKEILNQKLTLRTEQIEGLQALYKEANIEYEKVAYLDSEEVQKEMKRIKEEESKALDEIANILFVNKKEKAVI